MIGGREQGERARRSDGAEDLLADLGQIHGALLEEEEGEEEQGLRGREGLGFFGAAGGEAKEGREEGAPRPWILRRHRSSPRLLRRRHRRRRRRRRPGSRWRNPVMGPKRK